MLRHRIRAAQEAVLYKEAVLDKEEAVLSNTRSSAILASAYIGNMAALCSNENPDSFVTGLCNSALVIK